MNLNAGDLIAIPVGDKFGFAKVIYASEYFKDVILLRLFKGLSDAEASQNFPDSRAPAALYYTSSDPIKKGRWKRVGQQEVSLEEKAMSKRLVGGTVWIEDVHIGPASDEDMSTLPKMLTYGYRLIEKAAASQA